MGSSSRGAANEVSKSTGYGSAAPPGRKTPLLLVQLDQPDIPELHRVAMVLQQNRAGLGGGHVGDAELDVELEVAGELLLSHDVARFDDFHGVALDHLPARRLTVLLHPAVEGLAVEEDEGAVGRRDARHVNLVLGLLEL